MWWRKKERQVTEAEALMVQAKSLMDKLVKETEEDLERLKSSRNELEELSKQLKKLQG